MVRRTTRKERGVIKRHQKKLILVGAEGDNQTERKYLESLNNKQNEYRIIFAKGIHTNPQGVITDLIKSSNKVELDEEYGDIKACLIDVDYPGDRESELKNAILQSNKEHIKLYLSNPCFEIWFLLHFRYSTRQYSSNSEVIKELKEYMPGYTKSDNVFDLLWPKLDTAISNSKKLDKYHNQNNTINRIKKVPYTEVFNLMNVILKDPNEGGDV